MSSSSMNTPVQTASRVHHLRATWLPPFPEREIRVRSRQSNRYTESVIRNSPPTPPGGPAKRRGRPPAGGREAILAAALELLRERGIARVTSREVAALAGVSEASVFYHYKDRAGLLRAVFEQGLAPLQALAQEVSGMSGADMREV